MKMSTTSPLVFAHLGDLHLTDAQQQNYRDLLSITAEIEAECARQLDFVFLPGDNADNGTLEQYRLVAIALGGLSVPVHAIAGDHDMEQGSLAAFYNGLGASNLPFSIRLKRHRLLFLDCCGNGAGGPDFRLGPRQLDWVRSELADANARTETPLVFMHSYPDDLRAKDEARALIELLSSQGVALVEMGHTHYNEIANDGTTIYVATRSTGQIEEGPVGYSLTTVDGGIVGWRFKPVGEPFPFVMITAPADHRLLRGQGQRVGGICDIRALVLGEEPLARVDCRVGGDDWMPMSFLGAEGIWSARAPVPTGETIPITVRAVTHGGREAMHSILAAGDGFYLPERPADGSDRATIGAWPENGILGTQLGPNRNGRKW